MTDQTNAEQVACGEFKWLGQSPRACDECGVPFWEHTTYRGKPITPEWAAAVWRKW